MSIRLCIGDYAQKGYEPENMGINVYCLEELCFFIRENACLLDDSLASGQLIQWIREECGLTRLAEELDRAIRKKAPLKGFIEILLNYSGFFSEEEKQEILLAVAENNQLSGYEKRKAKADALVMKKSYGLAGREYAGLLRQLPDEERKMRGEIYHGCGVCLAGLFYFKLAGEYFLKAHEMTGRVESFRQYLWTKRLSMTKDQYVAYLSTHQEAYEDSLSMEEELESIKEGWQDSHNARLLEMIRTQQEETGNSFGQRLTERVEYLKSAYREMTYKPY